jgi:hypothetical protein
LSYYGYRYYDVNLGRWVNRDPIGERGSRNLCSFLDNSPLTAFDPFGLTVNFPPVNGKFTNASSVAVATIKGDFEALEVKILGFFWFPLAYPRNWFEHFSFLVYAGTSTSLRLKTHFVSATVAPGASVPGSSSLIIDADFLTGATRTVYENKCCTKRAKLPVKIGPRHLYIHDCPPTSGDPAGVFIELHLF